MTGRARKSPTTSIITGIAVVVGLGFIVVNRLNIPPVIAGEQAEEAVQAVTVANPTVKKIVEWDEYTGRFEAVDDVEVRARVSGYLTEVAFTSGEVVEAGDLLFRIDPRPFAAELAAANAALDHATAAYHYAKSEAERGKELVKQRALSQEEGDRREQAMQQAAADRAAAQASVTQAELNLEFTEVRAPITGRVSDNYVSVGNLIVGGADGGTLLTTQVSTDPIYFEFTASEAEYLKYLRLAQQGSRISGRYAQHPVRVKLMDEESYTHEGLLTFVDNQLDRSTGTMRGRATLNNPDDLFSPGMFGRLQLLGSGKHDVVLIPDTAVQTDQAQKFVWVVGTDDIAQRRPIELGPAKDGERIVRSGLEARDRIIVGGTQFVRDQMPVTPIPAEPSALLTLR
ncbi:Efflux pump periplasmic linker BepF [Halioglobus japonicus]|nr:Efflux pump periplasmic linker BepF [Halioglobus japonicus]